MDMLVPRRVPFEIPMHFMWPTFSIVVLPIFSISRNWLKLQRLPQ